MSWKATPASFQRRLFNMLLNKSTLLWNFIRFALKFSSAIFLRRLARSTRRKALSLYRKSLMSQLGREDLLENSKEVFEFEEENLVFDH
jgi:hypothetical protein